MLEADAGAHENLQVALPASGIADVLPLQGDDQDPASPWTHSADSSESSGEVGLEQPPVPDELVAQPAIPRIGEPPPSEVCRERPVLAGRTELPEPVAEAVLQLLSKDSSQQFRWGTFAFKFKAERTGKSGWQCTCLWHRASEKTLCKSYIAVKAASPASAHMDAVRRLVFWASQAGKYNRKRTHGAFRPSATEVPHLDVLRVFQPEGIPTDILTDEQLDRAEQATAARRQRALPKRQGRGQSGGSGQVAKAKASQQQRIRSRSSSGSSNVVDASSSSSDSDSDSD